MFKKMFPNVLIVVSMVTAIAIDFHINTIKIVGYSVYWDIIGFIQSMFLPALLIVTIYIIRIMSNTQIYLIPLGTLIYCTCFFSRLSALTAPGYFAHEVIEIFNVANIPVKYLIMCLVACLLVTNIIALFKGKDKGTVFHDPILGKGNKKLSTA